MKNSKTTYTFVHGIGQIQSFETWSMVPVFYGVSDYFWPMF